MNKKKIILIIVLGILVCIILSIILIFTFVVGTKQGDWHYKLHNNYEIWRVNSKEITIGKREDNILKDTINDSITEFKYNDTFVITKCLNSKEEVVYYIINMQEDIIYGPFNEKEYLDKEKELSINIDNWSKTKPTPKGANYY